MVDALDSPDGKGEAESVEMRTVDADWGKIPENSKIGDVEVNTTNIPVASGKTVKVTVDNETVTFATGS